MKKIMIMGACSAIARETARFFAADGATLYLVDLSEARLNDTRDDINALFNTDIFLKEFDATDVENHDNLINEASEKMDGLDAVLIAHGTLPNQEETRKSSQATMREFLINGTSVISLSTAAANYFEKQGRGAIAVISSVAGDRGRQSNYIYGSAKSAVSIFLQGLRNRLSRKGITVTTIKPGMVDTPMTANMTKGPLFAKPRDIGKGIFKAMKSGRDVVYLPGYWRIIMLIIKLIPESIFKKLSL